MSNIKVLILAGGVGKRLWPLSREKWPKFMLNFGLKESLLQMAYARLDGLVADSDRYIVAAESLGFLIRKEIRKINNKFDNSNVILEPAAKNTAPAIMLGINDFDAEDVVVVLPADHIIKPVSEFMESIKKAIAVAEKGYIVTLGISPTYPSTGYGYIKKSSEAIEEGWRTEVFKEKPDSKTAKEYVDDGNYYWNSGIFVFKTGVMKAELKEHCNDIYSILDTAKESGEELAELYSKIPAISIDYAVMEKTTKAAVVSTEIDWNDLGSWEAVSDVLSKSDCVYSNSDKEDIDCKNVFILSEEKKLTACVGLEDIIVIDTNDSLLIMKKGEGQRVKDIVDQLKNRPEIKYGSVDQRPWGGYQILDAGQGHKVKILEVDPGERLSLQKHEHRDEIWTVISGEGRITVGEKQIELGSGKTIDIPVGVLHRAENTGNEKLRILELALGADISEDDIIRIEDDYKR